MRKSIIALAALALTSTTALATDMDPAPEGFNWSGFYVGAWAGYSDFNREINIDDGGLVLPPGLDPADASLDGFVGGGIVGVNFQWDQIVVGVEGDIGFASVEDNTTGHGPLFPFLFAVPGTSVSEEVDMTYALRARLGYAVDRALIFLQGGVAWAEYEAKMQGFPVPPPFDDEFADDTLFGFQIGGGVEYAVADNITVRLDYLYTDYEDTEYENVLLGPTPPLGADAELDSHTIRMGVNFLFNAF